MTSLSLSVMNDARPEIPLRPPFQTVSTVLLSSHIKGHYQVTLGSY